MLTLYQIYKILFKAYGPQYWWPADTAFEMMTGAILTQNISWSNVEKAIANFKGDLSPELIRDLSIDELKSIIRPSGFFNQKAVRLKNIALWFQHYNDHIEKLKENKPEQIRKELLSINGVGRETADSILLYACKMPYFVIDAYTRRLFSRLGYPIPEEYDSAREYIQSRLPGNAELFNEYHALIVKQAKLHCKKSARCTNCPLIADCPSRQSP